MTEVILINPPLSQEDRYGKLAPFGNHLPNLGLAYTAAYLRENGVSVDIIDAAALGWSVERTAKTAASRLPLLAGLTASTVSVSRAAAVAAKIKFYSPDTKIALGGPHVTNVPEETLGLYRSVDFGIIGEGEQTALELARALRAGESGDKVPGLIVREIDRRERRSPPRSFEALLRTPPRAPMDDLDDLPMPAWDLLPDLQRVYRPSPQSFRRLPSSILVTSRGCPFRCSFCDQGTFGHKYRAHSPVRIYEMMAHLNKVHGIRDIAFHDEVFVVSEKKVVELCQHILRNDLDVTWSCMTRADLPVTEFALRMMKEAGCWQIQFGVESGSDDMLRRMRKDLSTADIASALSRASAAGIRTKGFILLGFPGETEKTLAETEEFILRADLDDAMIGFFAPFPGIDAMEGIEEHGRVVANYDKRSDHFVAYIPNGLTEQTLINARNRMYRRFYLRPKVIGSQFKRLGEPTMRPHLLRAARKFLSATR
ncbi:B12-binding domain-containing radical SAM protein [bacterium]|nr:B12-binding domain-containing radical SAM protein [bacterium]